MNNPLEARIAGLIAAYADQAPVAVQPQAMARLAAMRGGPGATSTAFRGGLSRPGLRWGAVALVLALTAALSAGLLVAGGPLRLGQDRPVLPGVAPFVGLPPVGAPASQPERGELVLSYWMRVTALGREVAQGLLYADGRLIWQRNLEGNEAANEIFGAVPPTTGTIEQRLTPFGVQVLLQHILASRSFDPDGNGHPGHLGGGDVRVRIDGQMRAIRWEDPGLPKRIADPGSWLPAEAWADRRILGYVPSRYAACHGPDLNLSDLPEATADLLRGVRGYPGPGSPSPIGTCYDITTDVARQVAATLEAAGIEPFSWGAQQAYRVAPESCCGDLWFFELLPDGELLLRGG